ncbi:MAG: uroporphyrinogen decarboxylase family protein [Planctomycetota bacterium]
MTPRERVLAVLHGRKPDKVPFTIYENKIPQCAVERRLRNEGLCIVNRRQSSVIQETPNCVQETLRYSENGQPRERTVIRTPVGEVSSIRQPAEGTAWTLEKFFKRPEDYKVLHFFAQDTQYRLNYEAFVEAEKWMGEDVILRDSVGTCPLHDIMIHWMDVEIFSQEWAERRDEILKLEKVMREKLVKVFPLLANAPITHAGFSGNEVPEVMGPPRYKEFCIPLFNECAEVFHKKGKLLCTHLDGNNKPWADAVAASGLDCIEAFTPAPDTDMTLAEALKVWPNKILWINFPSSVHLYSAAEIKQTTRELIAAAGETNRLIIGITENIPADRWQESLSAISEVINES